MRFKVDTGGNSAPGKFTVRDENGALVRYMDALPLTFDTIESANRWAEEHFLTQPQPTQKSASDYWACRYSTP